MLKSAMPLALVVSPLLLAAAQPPVLDSIGADCRLETDSAAAVQRTAVTAGTFEDADRAVVTSDQELSLFSRDRLANALRLMLSNPYHTEQNRPSPPVRSQNRCITVNPQAKSAMTASTASPHDAIPTSYVTSLNTSLNTNLNIGTSSIPASGIQIADLPILQPATEAPASSPAAEPPPATETAPAAQPPTAIDPVEVTPAPLPSQPTVSTPATNSINPNNITPTTVNPTPFDGKSTTVLSALADGNYRYLSGVVEDRPYTDEELAQQGGSVFLLNKSGNRITGHLMPRIGLTGMCVTGLASGNTITGSAYPYDTTDTQQDSAREIGETFEPYGSGALQIRRTRTDGNGLYYASAILDLSNYAMINAGSTLPPTQCSVGPTGFRDQSQR